MVSDIDTIFTLEKTPAASIATTERLPTTVRSPPTTDAVVDVDTLFVASTAPAAAEVAPKSPWFSAVAAFDTVEFA